MSIMTSLQTASLLKYELLCRNFPRIFSAIKERISIAVFVFSTTSELPDCMIMRSFLSAKNVKKY